MQADLSRRFECVAKNMLGPLFQLEVVLVLGIMGGVVSCG